MPDNNSVPMLAPDGSVRQVPQEQTAAAVQAGGKLVTQMVSPQGEKHWVPFDSVHDAISAGGQLAPPALTVGAPQNQPAMQQVDVAGNPQKPSQFMGAPAIPDALAPGDNAVTDAMAGVARGIVKGAGQTIAPGPRTAQAINTATGMSVPSTATPELQTQGLAEGAGATGEGILEFIMGDAALKGLSLSEKLAEAANVTKLLEKPGLTGKLINAGLKTVRGAAVSGAQSYLHDPSAASAATGAAFGAGGEATSEGLSSLSQYLAPKAFKAIKALVETRNLEEQASVMEAEARAGNAFESAPKNSVKKVLGAIPTDAAGSEVPIHTFKDAADVIHNESKNLYSKIDDLTDGKYSVLKKSADDAYRLIRRAANPEDLQKAETAYQSARDGMDDMLENTKGLSKDDVLQAKKTWKAQNVLNEIHGKIDKLYGLPQSAAEVAGIPKGANIIPDFSRAHAALRSAFRLPEADLGLVLEPKDILNLNNTVSFANAANERAGLVAKEGAANIRAAEGARRTRGLMFAGGAPATAIAGAFFHPLLAAPAVHTLFAYPELGAPVFKALGKASPIAAQTAKQVIGKDITHAFDPESGTVEPVSDNQ